MRPFEYLRAERPAQVVELLCEDGIRPLAGGTDLLTLMKGDVEHHDRLIDIGRLPGMREIAFDDERGLRLGALATLAEIETSELVRSRLPMLAEACAVAATPQLRHMATVGGNLLQRPRCWYFRSPHVRCWLQGGTDCPAIEGEHRLHAIFRSDACVAVHPSDLAPVFVALDARVLALGPGGERVIEAREFFAMPEPGRRRETTLGGDELIVGIEIPAATTAGRGRFLKAMERAAWAFAIVSVAAWLRIEDDRVAEARLALGGVAPIPWRADAAEAALRGAPPGNARFERAADIALEGAEPLEGNRYKLPLARALIVRALREAAGRPSP